MFNRNPGNSHVRLSLGVLTQAFAYLYGYIFSLSSYQTCTAKLKWLPAVKIISSLLLQDSAQMID